VPEAHRHSAAEDPAHSWGHAARPPAAGGRGEAPLERTWCAPSSFGDTSPA
jgi:hypothetical protein